MRYRVYIMHNPNCPTHKAHHADGPIIIRETLIVDERDLFRIKRRVRKYTCVGQVWWEKIDEGH